MNRAPIAPELVRWIVNSRPTAVLAVAADGVVNATTVAWYAPANDRPLMIALSLHSRSFSLELWKDRGGQATLNLLGEQFIDQITGPGFVSGRTEDKAKLFGIRYAPSAGGGVAIADAFFSVGLSINQVVSLPRSSLLVCDVVAAEADPESHADGLLTLSDPRWKPVHHLGEHEYVSMGTVRDWSGFKAWPSPNKRG